MLLMKSILLAESDAGELMFLWGRNASDAVVGLSKSLQAPKAGRRANKPISSVPAPALAKATTSTETVHLDILNLCTPRISSLSCLLLDMQEVSVAGRGRLEGCTLKSTCYDQNGYRKAKRLDRNF